MAKEPFDRFQEESPATAVKTKPLKGDALKKRLAELGIDTDPPKEKPKG